MTVDAFTSTPIYVIAGAGPYAIPHPYSTGALAVLVRAADGLITTLDPGDYTIAPVSSVTSGTVTLAAQPAIDHAGLEVAVVRAEPQEQGWTAAGGAREAGFAAQLDAQTKAIQDMDARLQRAPVMASFDRASAPLQLDPPEVGRVLVGKAGGFEVGPSADEVSGAQAYAEAAAADRVATADDRVATGGDRTQTGLDRIATAADRVQTGADAVATGDDAAATTDDRTQTGLDRIATNADRVQTGLDAAALGTHTSDNANPHATTAAQIGLSNVDNTTDVDKPVSTAAQTALDGKVSDTLVYISDQDERVKISGTAVFFPLFQVLAPGAGAVNAGFASTLTEHAISQTGAKTYHYIDLAEVTVANRIKSTSTRPTEGPETFILGTSVRGTFTPHRGLPITDLDQQAEIDAAVRLPGLNAERARFMRAESDVDGCPVTRDEYYAPVSTKHVHVTPQGHFGPIRLRGNGYADLTHFPAGASQTIYANNTFRVYAGIGRTFFGEGTSNQLTVTGGGAVTVYRVGGAILVSTSNGATLAFSTIADIVPDLHVVIGGQSHGNTLYSKGLGGISRALHDGDLASNVDDNLGFTNISEGGTGVVEPGASGAFWDTVGDIPSALLNTKMQIIDDQVTAGWPLPEYFTFDCGDADRAVFTGGSPLTVAVLAGYVGSVLDEIRSHCAGTADCMLVLYGAARINDDDLNATSDVNCTAVREAYLIAAEARSWVHVVQSKAHRDRPLNDVHLSPLGAWKHGYEIARYLGEVENGTPDLYPEITAATYRSGGRSAILTLTAATGGTVILPEPTHSENHIKGPFPAGLGIIGVGGDATNSLLDIEWMTILPDGRVELHVAEGQSVINGRVITHAGRLINAIGGDFIRDDSFEVGAGRGLQPMRFGPINTLEV